MRFTALQMKTETIQIRVTPEEKKVIVENANKNELSISDYVRVSSLRDCEIVVENKTSVYVRERLI